MDRINKIDLNGTKIPIIPVSVAQNTGSIASVPTLSANTTIEVQANKTTTIASTSTATQYPTAKAVMKKILNNYGFNFTTYQVVEYVQATGTQYIDSGAKVKANTAIKSGMLFSSAFNYNMMYGSWSSFAISLRAADTVCAAGGNTSVQNAGIVCATSTYYDIEHKPGTLKIGANSVTLGSSSNSATGANIFIFAAGNGGTTPYQWSTYGQGRIYYLKIYEGTALTHWFIPCYRKSDSVIGLFDLVNGVFKTNAGSGTFGKGSDITF